MFFPGGGKQYVREVLVIWPRAALGGAQTAESFYGHPLWHTEVGTILLILARSGRKN